MKSVLGKVLCRIVQKVGWKLNRVKGSHHIYTQENNSVILVIPVHGNRDLPIGTLKAILKDAGLTEDDLNL
ncbi:type II toxin-antitoxin system HicA family toxin [Planktothrix sp.]|uniref:type II toxin-antitoxin system HicA family toxin n=1 Tax=Planktothrix sp. TaxID=3088171 RepID=UPI0038D3EC92